MQLIDKAAVVAEIEKRIEICAKQREDMLNVQCHALADDASARIGALNCIKDFINTLEAKEVNSDEDLDKEIQYMYKRDNSTLKTEKQYAKYAKHFFKLGLKAQKGG